MPRNTRGVTAGPNESANSSCRPDRGRLGVELKGESGGVLRAVCTKRVLWEKAPPPLSPISERLALMLLPYLNELLLAVLIQIRLGLGSDGFDCAHKCVCKLPDSSKRVEHCQQVQENSQPLKRNGKRWKKNRRKKTEVCC